MNCWFGKTKSDYKVMIRKQTEIAERGIPFKRVIKTLKDGHPSWMNNIKKYMQIGLSLGPDNLVEDQVPSLEKCYTMLGRAMVRRAFMDRVASDISAFYGSYITRCREVELLRIQCTQQVSLIQEMIWALLDKEWKENHVEV